jgi:hypothetical protein
MSEKGEKYDVFISYRRDGGATEARLIQAKLLQQNLRVFLDVDSLRPGHFDEALLKYIAEAPNFVVILSPDCLDRCIQEERDWLRQEIAQAVKTTKNIVPIIMPGFRFPPPEELPEDIRALVRHHGVSFSHEFFGAMIETVIKYLKHDEVSPVEKSDGSPSPHLSTIAAEKRARQSKKNLHLVRLIDEQFDEAVRRQDSIILIRGSRQMGKTIALTRGLQRAREAGARVAFTDLQKFVSYNFETVENFLMALGDSIADQLDLDVFPFDVWNHQRGPAVNFSRYLRREVLNKAQEPIVWGLDEVDRLFSYPYSSEVFGLFRSWHNARVLNPEFEWLTLAIAYSTGTHLFITDTNQSPFNVGTRLHVVDFTLSEITELNHRFGTPLKGAEELRRFYELLGGHPSLVRLGLRKLGEPGVNLEALESCADPDDGPFSEHLKFTLALLEREPQLHKMVKDMVQGRPSFTSEGFNHLQVTGILIGDSIVDAKFRCKLYADYFGRKLRSPEPDN